ncbi:MAG: hypothetical protein AMXMBFR64_07080 [Myxococcales bacterium]
MTPDLPPIPEDLVDAAASDRLLVVVGAGASRADSESDAPPGLPGWRELVEQLADEAESAGLLDAATSEEARREARCGNPITAASLLPEGWAKAQVAARFSDPTLRPTITHRALAALPGAAFLTTNYDGLLERALRERGGPAEVCTISEVERIARFDVGHVLKLHGDAASHHDLVLTHADFRGVYHNAEAWRRVLSAFLTQGQVLLVGYGYGDPHLVDEITRCLADFEGHRVGPFWLEPTSRLVTARADGHLRLIGLTSLDQVAPFLEALAAKARDRRAQRSGTRLARVVVTHLPHELRDARQRFGEGRFEEALALYRRALELVDALPSRADAETRRNAEALRLNVASSLLCLQRVDEAREVLLAVDPQPLDDKGRGVLAQGLVQVRELESARALLPAQGDGAVALARQLLALAEGRMPEPLADELMVTLPAARHLVDRGRAWSAARLMLRALDQETLPRWRLAALDGLLRAISATVLEFPAQEEPIPVAERPEVVRRFEESLRELPDETLPGPLRGARLSLETRYAWLTMDPRTAELHRRLQAEYPQEPAPDAELGSRLDVHPWLRRLEAVGSVAERDPDEARPLAEELARQWPGRGPIEWVAAQVLTHAGDLQAAVPHMEAAVAALPCSRFRRVAGVTMACAASGTEEPRRLLQRAWELLVPFAHETGPDVLQARALAASSVAPAEAVSCWTRYADATDSPQAWIQLGREHLMRGQERDAEAAILRAGHVGWAALTAKELGDATGILLAMAGSVDRRATLIAMGRALHDKLATTVDPAAHGAYFRVCSALDWPAELPPPDMDSLAQRDVVTRIPAEVGLDLLRLSAATAAATEQNWREGAVPFSLLCAALGRPPAELFAHLVAERSEPGTYPAPLPNPQSDPLPSAGVELLVGALEILWLHHLGLLDALRDQRPGWRLVVFEDVFEQAVRAIEIPPAAEHATLMKIRARACDAPGIDWHRPSGAAHRGPDDSDTALAIQLGAVLVDDTVEPSSGAFSTATLVRALFSAGVLPRDQAEQIIQGALGDGRPTSGLLPPAVVLRYAPLWRFEAAGALDALVRATPVHVGPETARLIDDRWDRDRLAIQAHRAARDLRAWLQLGRQEGWIRVDSRPPVPELDDPEVRDRHPLAADYLRELLQRWRWCNGQRRILVAEAAASALHPVALLDAARALAPLPSLASTLHHERTSVRKREVHLPDLVDRLCPPAEAMPKREQLAEHGTIEALGSDLLKELARRYATLDQGRPARLLAAVPAAFRRAHLGQGPLVLFVAQTFAAALADTWLPDGADLQAAERLTRALLDTAEESGKSLLLARHSASDAPPSSVADPGALTQPLLVFLGLAALRTPLAAFTREGDAYASSMDAPAGRMWTAIGRWVQGAPSRREPAQRALSDLWVSMGPRLQDSGEGPPPELVSLEQATLALAADTGPHALTRGALATLVIASSQWEQQPLERVGLRVSGDGGTRFVSLLELVQRCVSLVEAQPRALVDADGDIQFTYEDAGGLTVAAEVPAEAVVLRLGASALGTWATWAAARFGPLDGRLHDAFLGAASDPADGARLEAAAVAAARAPWRHMRQDPSWLFSWQLGGVPFATLKDVDELRQILSEPGPLPDGPLVEILRDRLTTGAWSHRRDKWELLLMLARIPGPLANLSATLLDADERSAELLNEALGHMRDPDSVPTGWLSASLVVLRAAAAQKAVWDLPAGQVDLRSELPRLVEGVIGTLVPTTSPTGDAAATLPRRAQPGFARREPQILRLCQRVVESLAGADAPPRERMWLTWRLATWFITLLDAAPLEARQAFMQRLDEHGLDAWGAPHSSDVPDPARYAGGRQLRTMAVLHALRSSEELARSRDGAELHSVATRGVLAVLRELASREPTPDEREHRRGGRTDAVVDWSPAATVPDLAMLVLLRLDSDQWASLAPDVRLRWLKDAGRPKHLPDTPPDPVRPVVLVAAAQAIDEASDSELEALEVLHRTGAETLGDVAHFAVSVALHALGRIPVDPGVHRLLAARAQHPNWAAFAGRHLLATARSSPDQLAGEVDELDRLVAENGGDRIAVALALGSAAMEAPPAGRDEARVILAGLATRDPWQHDVRVRQLLAALEQIE